MERKQYKRYSREFKLEAGRLAALGERPKAQIARELGIRVNELRKWKLEFEAEERAGGAPRQTPATRAILRSCGVRTHGSERIIATLNRPSMRPLRLGKADGSATLADP